MGTGTKYPAGKEDPVELHFGLVLYSSGGDSARWEKQIDHEKPLPCLELYLPFSTQGIGLDRKFGWGGTPSKEQRRCPKLSSVRTEISR